MERWTPFSAQKSANSRDVYWQPRSLWKITPRGGSVGDQCGGEGFNDQGGAQVVGDGVADDLAGVQVDHGGGAGPAVDGLDVAVSRDAHSKPSGSACSSQRRSATISSHSPA